MSEVKKGNSLSIETRNKISTKLGTAIYVYTENNIPIISFSSVRKAGKIL